MKFLIVLLLAAGLGLANAAETLYLKDGSVISGETLGETPEAVLFKTRYGSLTVNKKDIARTEKTASPSEPPPEREKSPFTFKTVKAGSSAVREIYYKNGIVIATRTVNLAGNGRRTDGALEDGVYFEYREDGTMKTRLEIKNGKKDGFLISYHPNGEIQSMARYKNGEINGKVEIFNENGTLLFAQNFIASVPNGFFRQYDEKGKIVSETFYINGFVGPSPVKKAEASSPGPETEPPEEAVPASSLSMTTAKLTPLARGERYLFYQNEKYIGKIIVAANYHVLSKSGKIPDGVIPVYSEDGDIRRELTLVSNDLVYMKIFKDGEVVEEYSYLEDIAIKKK